MLTCPDVRLLTRRADGEPMEPRDAAALEAHLRGCVSCREALSGQQAVASTLRRRPSDLVSPWFAARLSRRLDEDAGWIGLADWRAWTFRLAPAAAALALAAYLTSAQTASPSLDLEEWAMSNADASTAATLLWDTDVTSDLLLERMLVGEDTESGGTPDGR